MKIVKKFAVFTLALNLVGGPLNVLANETSNANIIKKVAEARTNTTIASVKKFDLYGNEMLKPYDNVFKMPNTNIKAITNNGGKYFDSTIDKAIDDNMNTHWETGRPNSTSFTNEVIIQFHEVATLNRIVYAARQSTTRGKGFAQQFDIYSSTSDTGNDFTLVSSGEYTGSTGDIVEIQFKPTTFKRVKFVFTKANQDWASASEFQFYKEDAFNDKIAKLFTDGTMTTVSPEFNSIEQLNTLEEEAKTHPLYASYKETLALAKKALNGEVVTEGRIIIAEQHGDMVQHANQQLKFGFGNNLQPTGLAAQPGDQITVYVDTAPNRPLPRLTFAQQEGAWNSWRQSVSLNPGKNVITVPAIPKTTAYKKAVTPGGTIYIENPYTPNQQGKAPTLRFEGVDRIPFATKSTNVEAFKQFLIDYKKKIDEDIAKHPNVEDRKVLDIVEIVGDHLFWTGTATGAYKTYIEQGYSPLQTIESYNRLMDELFNYNGLDGRSEQHDPKFIRENIRLAQPYAYMYAAGDHIGTLDDVVSSILIPIEELGGSWGVIHEIGHRMDIGVRTYVEVTNNMLPQYMSAFYGKIDGRIPYEANIYKNVLYENTKDYNKQGFFERLAVFWQLEMYSPGYWGKLNSLYRERNVTLSDGDRSKQQYLVEFSSEALGLDLSEHFARHGFVVTDETKAKTSKYPKPDKKIWYLNNRVIGYQGNGLNEKEVHVTLTSNQTAKTNTLHLSIDKADQDDFLGYEIFRDNELIGFTSTGQFIDKNIDTTKNYTYKVVGYDKKLNTLKPVEVKAFTPTLSVEDNITIKLHQAFNPLDYVKAIAYNGKDLTKMITIKSNTVDVTKKGSYEVVYEINDEGIKETKTMNVNVASEVQYISDMTAKSAKVGWGSLQKDQSIAGGTITLLRQGVDVTYAKGLGAHANSEVVYDIEGKGFDFFESYIGIDQVAKGEASSATFEVWVDGEQKFASDVFKANTDRGYINIPVTGAKEVKLITTDANDRGNSSDHTIWADAKFYLNTDRVFTFTQNLTLALEDAKAMNLENYTVETSRALQASIAKAQALLANAQATQAQIDQVLEELTQAKAALVATDFNPIITIADSHLKAAIQQTLGISEEITLDDITKLTTLHVPNARITSLEGLQYAKNLISLNISGNSITDFSPLQHLSQLTNINAHPQIVEVTNLTGPIVTVENLVKGLDGHYLNPYQIALRNIKTFKEIVLDVNQLASNADHFTIDLSQEEQGMYMLVIAYKLNDDTLVQLTYYVINP